MEKLEDDFIPGAFDGKYSRVVVVLAPYCRPHSNDKHSYLQLFVLAAKRPINIEATKAFVRHLSIIFQVMQPPTPNRRNQR